MEINRPGKTWRFPKRRSGAVRSMHDRGGLFGGTFGVVLDRHRTWFNVRTAVAFVYDDFETANYSRRDRGGRGRENTDFKFGVPVSGSRFRSVPVDLSEVERGAR